MVATKLVLEATADWKSPKPRWLQVASFRKLVDKNSLLGFPKNLERDKYVHTPIIDALGREDDFGLMLNNIMFGYTCAQLRCFNYRIWLFRETGSGGCIKIILLVGDKIHVYDGNKDRTAGNINWRREEPAWTGAFYWNQEEEENCQEP